MIFLVTSFTFHTEHWNEIKFHEILCLRKLFHEGEMDAKLYITEIINELTFVKTLSVRMTAPN